MNLLYEGKAKKIFSTDVPGRILHKYKDDATAFDGKKKGQIVGKGQVNAEMSAILFEYLRERGIENHLIEFIAPDSLITHELEMLPLEVVARNIAAGSLSKRTGLDEGTPLSAPLVEFYLKDDALGDPLLCIDHIRELGIVPMDDVSEMRHLAMQVNLLLVEFFADCQLDLVDFKLEFGRYDDRVVLGDEISPDTCRLWDMETRERLDKDRFRRDLGGVEEAYAEVFRRVKERASAG